MKVILTQTHSRNKRSLDLIIKRIILTLAKWSEEKSNCVSLEECVLVGQSLPPIALHCKHTQILVTAIRCILNTDTHKIHCSSCVTSRKKPICIFDYRIIIYYGKKWNTIFESWNLTSISFQSTFELEKRNSPFSTLSLVLSRDRDFNSIYC